MKCELRVGLIVPFRDEQSVLPRKLDEIPRLQWPDGEHYVVFVDDHSRDAGATLVRSYLEQPQGDRVHVWLLPATGAAGKPHAVARGVEALGTRVDIIVLTDADVLLAPQAVGALAAALAADPKTALVSGRQCFVDSLQSAQGMAVEAAGAWDRCTALVRSCESRLGSLFNVHGQLLAWRQSANLRPRPGLAADDLDLVFAVRRRKLGAVRMIQTAQFYEEKPRLPAARKAQALRRTRAFLQAMQATPYPGGGCFAYLQWQVYRWLPQHLWLLLLVLAGSLVFALELRYPKVGLTLALVSAGALVGLPQGRALLARLWILRQAVLAERRAPLSDHWARDRS